MTIDIHTESQAARPLHTPAAASRSLRDAVAAVNDHCLRTELRRLARAHEMTTARAQGNVTVPRGTFDAMRSQLVAAAALRRLVEQGPLIVVAFDARPPHAVREAPDALSRALGCAPESLYGRGLPQLFAPAETARVQRALHDDEAALTLMLQLRRADEHGARCCLHLLPPDATQPDLRWACLVRLPADDVVAEGSTRRALPKPAMRPRADPRPLTSSTPSF